MGEPTWGQRLAAGASAGGAGGVVSALVLLLLVEPVINQAIAIEEARSAVLVQPHAPGTAGHDHAAGEIVTRVQQQIGGVITVVVVAVLIGLAFTVVYARVARRMPGTTELGRSLSLAAIAFTVVSVMPALTIPANPPSVGDPSTVDQRTVTYLSTIALSFVAVMALFALDEALRSRQVSPEWRWLSLAGAGVAAVGLVMVFVPSVAQPIPPDVPASLIWQFRIRSLGQLAALWAGIGVVHGVLSHRRSLRAVGARTLEFV